MRIELKDHQSIIIIIPYACAVHYIQYKYMVIDMVCLFCKSNRVCTLFLFFFSVFLFLSSRDCLLCFALLACSLD